MTADRQPYRILPDHDVVGLDQHLERRGSGLRRAVSMTPEDIIETVTASGLRGRGGAGFPTGTKWATVADMAGDDTTVVVNAAEGEPGSYKDRTLLRRDPYSVIEGALIAARAVDADRVVVATKKEFEPEIARLRTAIAEFEAAGIDDVDVEIATGPSSYLFGEESALLEVVDGRPPFPRVTPPYRRGVGSESGGRNTASDAPLAGEGPDAGVGSPALVNNVETFAHVAAIFEHGVEAFRSVGTDASPGTTICTLTGAVQRHGVAEFPMGTPLWEVIDTLGGGPNPERTLIAAISGTANAVLTADRFDTPLCFDAMNDAGSGLGASGFIVFDDLTDLVSVAHGVARFLAVESCGQCEPCKSDGIRIAEHLDVIRQSDSTHRHDVDDAIEAAFETVADGARCGLASQQSEAVASLYRISGDVRRAHLDGSADESPVEAIAPIVSIDDGVARLDLGHFDKGYDWGTVDEETGATPVALAASTTG